MRSSAGVSVVGIRVDGPDTQMSSLAVWLTAGPGQGHKGGQGAGRVGEEGGQ